MIMYVYVYITLEAAPIILYASLVCLYEARFYGGCSNRCRSKVLIELKQRYLYVNCTVSYESNTNLLLVPKYSL